MKAHRIMLTTRLVTALTLLLLTDGWSMAQALFTDDFSDGISDEWSFIDNTSGRSWGPAIFEEISAAFHLESTGTIPAGQAGGAPSTIFSGWSPSLGPEFSDGFLRAVVTAETEGSRAMLYLRHNEGTGSVYLFIADSGDGTFRLSRIDSTQGNVLAEMESPSFAAGEDWFIEAGAVGDQLTMKVWPFGDAEPLVPQLMVTDSTYPEGGFGIGAGVPGWYEEEAQISATFDQICFALTTSCRADALQAGDADQDFDFDQLDLVRVQVAAKYLTGQAATWGEGDWDGAPGGGAGDPPAGDGLFNPLDIVSALLAGNYLNGPYAAVQPNGQANDGQTSIIYNMGTGELAVDTPAGTELTSINIDSAAGIFTGNAADNLGGSFDNDADNNIFKATFGSSFGSLSFGNVAQTGLEEDFLLNDLSVVGSLAGGGDLGDVDLIYVPEPSTLALLIFGLPLTLYMVAPGHLQQRSRMFRLKSSSSRVFHIARRKGYAIST